MSMLLDDYLKLPYRISLQLDNEGDWIARVEELDGCVAHGESRAEALERLDDVKRVWIADALEHGQRVPVPEPEEPLPSGKWLQRVPRSIHKRLSQLARREGTSLNQLVATVLSQYLGGALAPPQAPAQQVNISIGGIAGTASADPAHEQTIRTWKATGWTGLRVKGEPNTPNHRVTESRFDG